MFIIKNVHSADQIEDGTGTQTQFSVGNKSNNRIFHMILKFQTKVMKSTWNQKRIFKTSS